MPLILAMRPCALHIHEMLIVTDCYSLTCIICGQTNRKIGKMTIFILWWSQKFGLANHFYFVTKLGTAGQKVRNFGGVREKMRDGDDYLLTFNFGGVK